MNVFDAVKQSVTTRQAAELYGVKVRRNNMASCPFHKDKTPSMKVDKRFHCFGCGADGDVIDFVSRLYGISSLEAAQKIASDFGISYDVKSAVTKPKKIICRKTDAQIYAEAEQRCFRVLSDYYHLLKKWEIDYAPSIDDETWHPLFVEALQKKSHLEYLLDILVFGEIEEKALLVMEYGKEVASLEQRISEFTCRKAETGIGSSQ
ncbi:MAG: CHC2 zinc finger domain-containing protein [Clostridia bacterium]|uniref:CHC2 zinc finger domain-containing protein n=1 Tax=Faecalicatena contorta TaxID=39482 RepID=UPI001F2533A6|nr:CHC2 zinc finger domain-containing protein [Faecalicatena contorta]MCF2553759.1 DNA primase [Faecalicatena contorta]MDD7728744.1 CHC2 zinc finger domain-containing protein [Clostridia bacterium]